MNKAGAAKDAPRTFAALIDPKIKKVGCVLLQAAYGGDRTVVMRFFADSESWFLGPTPDMIMVRGTFEERSALARVWGAAA